MISIDTNVIVRVLTNDDPAQSKRALRLMRSDTIWISKTVLLETEWVLRHAYALDAKTIGAAFTKLLGVSTIEMEERDVVLRALAWHAAGMDLADALHLAASHAATAFATFDRRLSKLAKRAAVQPAVIAP